MRTSIFLVALAIEDVSKALGNPMSDKLIYTLSFIGLIFIFMDIVDFFRRNS